MALTQEQQAIFDAVISALQTNSKTIAQLAPKTTLGNTDWFEVSGGARISYTSLASLITAAFDARMEEWEDARGAANGIAPLDRSKKVPVANLPTSITAAFLPFAGTATLSLGDISSSGSIPADTAYNIYFSTLYKTFCARKANPTSSDKYVTYWPDCENYGTRTAQGITPVKERPYLDVKNGRLYIWDGSKMLLIGSGLTLGETQGTAYPGEKGYNLNYSLNQLTHDFDDFQSSRGKANGLAPLDADKRLPDANLPWSAKDVVEFSRVYHISDLEGPMEQSMDKSFGEADFAVVYCPEFGAFVAYQPSEESVLDNPFYGYWTDSEHYGCFSLGVGIIPVSGKLYVDTSTNTQYRWDGADLVPAGLQLGESASTAFPGLRGKQLADIAILPVDGTIDTHKALPNPPATGVWWLVNEGYFRFLSSSCGYTSADYNTLDSSGNPTAARTDRMFRIGAQLYKVSSSKLIASAWTDDVEAAKMAVFIDLFNEAAGSCGHAELTDGVFSCQLNGLTDITYSQMRNILKWGRVTDAYCKGKYYQAPIRTNLPFLCTMHGGGAADNGYEAQLLFADSQVEVVRLPSEFGICQITDVRGNYSRYFNAPKLHTILGIVDLSEMPKGFDNPNFPAFGKALVNVQIRNTRRNIYFGNCPKLSLESVRYCIAHRNDWNTETAEITITVHPDVYAKITDTDSTQGSEILALAAQMHVNIASTAATAEA